MMNATGKSFGKSFAKATSIGGDGLFYESIAEEAKSKKPPFNSATFRDTVSGAERTSSYVPGPGHYNTKVGCIKNNYVTKDSFFSGVIAHENDSKFYYTRENGGLIKHT